jgi:hypothetical protein
LLKQGFMKGDALNGKGCVQAGIWLQVLEVSSQEMVQMRVWRWVFQVGYCGGEDAGPNGNYVRYEEKQQWLSTSRIDLCKMMCTAIKTLGSHALRLKSVWISQWWKKRSLLWEVSGNRRTCQSAVELDWSVSIPHWCWVMGLSLNYPLQPFIMGRNWVICSQTKSFY